MRSSNGKLQSPVAQTLQVDLGEAFKESAGLRTQWGVSSPLTESDNPIQIAIESHKFSTVLKFKF